MRVELYSRRDSGPCDDARALLTRVRDRIPFELIEVDIDGDERLRHELGGDVPVVYLDGRKAFQGQLDEAALVDQLQRGAQAVRTLDPLANLDRGRPVARGTKLVFAAVAALGLSGTVSAGAVRKLVIEPELEIRTLDITPESFDAPPFSLADADGQTRSLADYRGRVVLLNFWASWCEPCRQEMPDMARLAMELGPRRDFAMVAVSVDEGWKPVQTFFQQAFGAVPPPFAVLIDQGGKVSESYGTSKYPETYVIDRQGKVVAKFIGARAWATSAAKRYLERLLD